LLRTRRTDKFSSPCSIGFSTGGKEEAACIKGVRERDRIAISQQQVVEVLVVSLKACFLKRFK